RRRGCASAWPRPADRAVIPCPEPTGAAGSRTEVFLRYLDYFRESVVAKVSALAAPELRHSRLPSGWTPLELLTHLRHVELRWIEWGFEGRDVAEPWGDRRDDRWYVAPDETLADLVAALRAQGAHTSAVVSAHDLAEIGAPGPRWNGCCCTWCRSTPATWGTSTWWPSWRVGRPENEAVRSIMDRCRCSSRPPCPPGASPPRS